MQNCSVAVALRSKCKVQSAKWKGKLTAHGERLTADGKQRTANGNRGDFVAIYSASLVGADFQVRPIIDRGGRT